jgi:hypothetical protein
MKYRRVCEHGKRSLKRKMTLKTSVNIDGSGSSELDRSPRSAEELEELPAPVMKQIFILHVLKFVPSSNVIGKDNYDVLRHCK